MEKRILLDRKKKFYKANLHCHSNLSDGVLNPLELKKLYKTNGYSILAITDHDHINNNSYLDDEDFITITGCEISIKEFENQSTLTNLNMKCCHLNLYAKEQDNDLNICYSPAYDHYTKGEKRRKLKKLNNLDYQRKYSCDGINEIIRLANENGFFVCYNHPRWSLENYKQYSGYEGLWGVEIYNTSVSRSGLYEYDPNVFDDFLRDGKRIFASVGDDNHNKTDDAFGAFTMVNCENLSYGNVIDALISGDFYVSTAPIIYELFVENMNVHIECSKVKSINLSTFGRRTMSVKANDEFVTCADFEIKTQDVYFRLDIVDEMGRHANTQAYFIK